MPNIENFRTFRFYIIFEIVRKKKLKKYKTRLYKILELIECHKIESMSLYFQDCLQLLIERVRDLLSFCLYNGFCVISNNIDAKMYRIQILSLCLSIFLLLFSIYCDTLLRQTWRNIYCLFTNIVFKWISDEYISIIWITNNLF